jgi:hypothetical protein
MDVMGNHYSGLAPQPHGNDWITLASGLDLYSNISQSQSGSITGVTPELSATPLTVSSALTTKTPVHQITPQQECPFPVLSSIPEASSVSQNRSLKSVSIPKQPKRFKCARCSEALETEHERRQHLTLKHKESRYFCDLGRCTKSYKYRKDLLRHHGSLDHRKSGTIGHFRCSCGKFAQRKDNHRRHTKSCQNKQKRMSQNPYVCACGNEEHDMEAHEGHIGSCDRANWL